jgi:hypothetical protein
MGGLDLLDGFKQRIVRGRGVLDRSGVIVAAEIKARRRSFSCAGKS